MRSVSLFSGCGGLDLGLMRAGFHTVLANDSDPRCAASYRANFPTVPFYEGSVSDLTTALMAEVSKDETEREISLLAGGPPCPPYSKSRFYRKNKPRGLEDKLGEITLKGYLAVLAALRPKAFILENVFGMAYEVHRAAFDLLHGTAKDLGYTCTWRVMNAADYGVPQIRERFFVVGMRDRAFEFPSQTHARPGSQELFDLFEPDLPSWRTAGQAISDLDTEENADDTHHFAGGQYHDLLVQIPPGQNYLFFTKERGHPSPVFRWRSRYWSYLLKLSPDLPSWTIQARRSNNMGPFHWRNRILRISEVKRLQTFPDDWKLIGTNEQQWRQLGNAVPPTLGYCVARAVFEQLQKGDRPIETGVSIETNPVKYRQVRRKLAIDTPLK